MDTQLKLLGRDHSLIEQPPIKHLKPSIDPSTLFYRNSSNPWPSNAPQSGGRSTKRLDWNSCT